MTSSFEMIEKAMIDCHDSLEGFIASASTVHNATSEWYRQFRKDGWSIYQELQEVETAEV